MLLDVDQWITRERAGLHASEFAEEVMAGWQPASPAMAILGTVSWRCGALARLDFEMGEASRLVAWQTPCQSIAGENLRYLPAYDARVAQIAKMLGGPCCKLHDSSKRIGHT